MRQVGLWVFGQVGRGFRWGGNPVNRVTLIVLFYAGLFLFHLCACEMNE